MYWSNCKKELTKEVKFCDGCGMPVASEQNSDQIQAQIIKYGEGAAV